jgi:hypothetical protein
MLSINYFKMNNNKLLYYFIYFIVVIVYLIFLIPANIDLSKSSAELFMDEQISYNEIYKIIHSKGFINIIHSIIGEDQRYGRIIYLIPSLFSIIPTLIFGESGQIISTRFIFFIFLFLSYFIIIKTFIKNEFISILLFISLICLPTTAYYSTMPKPEPFLLFFLALFLFYFIKKQGLFGWYYLFLGLAFGCKISIFPSILFFVLISVFLELKNGTNNFTDKYLLKNILKSALYFLLGFFICVPILPLSLIKPEFFKLYLYSTFLGTKHGSDNATVNIFIWIKSIFTTWFNSPIVLSVSVYALIISIIFYSFYKLRKHNFNNYNLIWIVLFVLSITQVFPIMLFVKRVWFFYLHAGFVFFIVLFFFSAERLIFQKRKLKIIYLFLFIFTFYSFIYNFNNQINYLLVQSKRTKTEDYLIQKDRNVYILSILNQYYESNKNLNIFHSPQFFKLPNFRVKEIWGFFTSWDEGADIVILSNSNNPKINIPETTNAEYNQWVKSNALYDRYLNGPIPKYIELPRKVQGLYIYKKID